MVGALILQGEMLPGICFYAGNFSIQITVYYCLLFAGAGGVL